jgi:hypothetical protein
MSISVAAPATAGAAHSSKSVAPRKLQILQFIFTSSQRRCA